MLSGRAVYVLGLLQLVFDFLSAYFLVHKQWLETSPAIVAFFEQLDEVKHTAAVLPATTIPAVELPVLPSPLEAHYAGIFGMTKRAYRMVIATRERWRLDAE